MESLHQAALQREKDLWAQKQKQLEQSLQKELEAARKLHTDALANQQSNANDSLQAALEQLQKEHDLKLKQALAEAAQRHRKEMEELEHLHKDSMGNTEQTLLEEMQQRLDALNKLKAEELEIALSRQDEGFRDKELDKQKAYEKELNAINLELHNLKQINKNLETHAVEDRSTIRQLEEKLANANRLNSDLHKQMDQKMVDYQENLTKREKELREAHRREIDRIIQENREASEQLKAEFDRMQSKMKCSAVLLEEKIAELEARYENRPSKEADIARISQLLSTVMEKQTTIDNLKTELTYFKMELENREENFNSRFGRSPIVNPNTLPTDTATMQMRTRVATATTVGSALQFSHPVHPATSTTQSHTTSPATTRATTRGGPGPPGKGRPANHRIPAAREQSKRAGKADRAQASSVAQPAALPPLPDGVPSSGAFHPD
eukprot:TRINITY_DN38523_c0_g1_i1.p1 TRINITY_DN38523_c0_g1~~TRINITY_DN38523_c0_g1_i1.p1  ORF type:complete len:490 (+),score=59.44 TRINITY_DN38523_c0_g1_i1:158-1471(+)